MRMVALMIRTRKVMMMAFGVQTAKVKAKAQSEPTLKGDRTGYFRKETKIGDEYQDFQRD